ncbi:uncharacterized protein [Antedon mediterranea]|uniref:uncharacterized protein n=1 Tax=Antedon mediterranea TaxID=105859 RepID=UPI003AF96ED4
MMYTAAETLTDQPMINTQMRVIGPVSIQWHLGMSNYKSDYTAMPLNHRIKKQQPSQDHHRKNNPHPEYVYHLRRMHNEPVCNVRTSEDDQQRLLNADSTSFITSMRHHYPILPVPKNPGTRWGCNKGKKVPAKGIVPTSPTFKLIKRIERMLPASTEPTTIMSTSHPFSYVPRRRRVVPPLGEDFAVRYDCAVEHQMPVVGKSEGTKRPARRKPVPSAPKDTLKVKGFDGGASRDPSSGRPSRRPRSTVVRRVKLPGWMTA